MKNRIALEFCAGGGGQVWSMERAGFSHTALVEMDLHGGIILHENRGEEWNVVEVREFNGQP